MRRILLPFVAILAFGMTIAGAQNLTKSLQGSQDPRGPVPLDATNNVFIPQHMNQVTPQQAPTYTNATAATGATNTDFAGVVTTSSTTMTLLFGQVYNSAPSCILQELAGTVAPTFTMWTTGINASVVASGKNYDYICVGANY